MSKCKVVERVLSVGAWKLLLVMALIAIAVLNVPPTSHAEMETSITPEQAVEKYLAWAPQGYDVPNPYEAVIVGFGARATPAVLAALAKDESGFVWILGQIGDPRAFDVLWDLFEKASNATMRMRVGFSLGSSLDESNIQRLMLKLEKLDPSVSLALLRQITRQDFEGNMQEWRAWLSNAKNLDSVVRYCKQRSIPILG